MLHSSMVFAMSQFLVLFTVPILARSYSIEEFASFAGFMTLYVVVGSVSTMRLADSIVKSNSEDVGEIVTACAYLFMAASLLVLLLCILLDFGTLSSIVCASSVLLFSFTRVFYFCALRKKRFFYASLTLALINISTVVFQIFLSRYSFGLYFGLVFALLLVVFVQLIVQGWLFSSLSVSGFFSIVKKQKGYTLYLSLFTLLSGFRVRLPYILMGATPSAGVLSQFERIANAPNMLISAVVRPVFFSTINKDDITTTGAEVVKGLFVILTAVGVSLMAFVEIYHLELVRFIFGDQWVDYSIYFYFSFSASMALMSVNWLDRFFDIIGKQKFIFWLELYFLISFFISIIALEKYFGEIGYFYAISVSAVLYCFLFGLIVFNLSSVGVRYFIFLIFSSVVLNRAVYYVVEFLSLGLGLGFWSVLCIFSLWLICFLVVILLNLEVKHWFKKYLLA